MATAAPAPERGRRKRILVVDSSPELQHQLREVSTPEHHEVVHLTRPQALLQALHSAPWDLVVAGPSEETADGLRRLAQLRAARPDMGLVVAVNGTDPADLSTFVKARPDELVRVPADADALLGAVRSALRAVDQRRGEHARNVVAASRLAPPPRMAHVVAVSGPTGGSGKTMVAINLVHALARSGRRVVLVDTDAQFGEVTSALQLRPAHTISDMLFDEGGMAYDSRTVREHVAELLTATAHGFLVAAAPADPAAADLIDGEAVSRLLAAIRTQAEVVVVDCSTGLGERTLAAFDHAERVVVVTQVDVPGIANLRTFLGVLDRLGLDDRRRTVLLNKELPDSGVTGRDVVQVIHGVAGVLPFDPIVARALNEGRPVIAADPHHPFSRTLAAVLARLLPDGDANASTPPHRRQFRWFRRIMR